MTAEINNSELIKIKNQVEEIDETLEIVFRLIEKRLSKLEILLTKNDQQK